MNTYYFSVLAVDKKRRLEVRRCVAVQATHYDLAEHQIISQHLFMLQTSGWTFRALEITQQHYESMCGILEVMA